MKIKLTRVILIVPLAILLSACHSYETYERLQNFYLSKSDSKNKDIKATEVLGSDWNRICLVNKYSDTQVIINATRRKFTFIENLHWFYISKVADFSEPTVLLYESKGVFFRMQPPLSKFIDAYPSSKRVLETRATCFDARNLYIRRLDNGTLELYEKTTTEKFNSK